MTEHRRLIAWLVIGGLAIALAISWAVRTEPRAVAMPDVAPAPTAVEAPVAGNPMVPAARAAPMPAAPGASPIRPRPRRARRPAPPAAPLPSIAQQPTVPLPPPPTDPDAPLPH